MPSLPTIACVGELLWDLLPCGRALGGAPANVAYHLARLGLPIRLVTRVGADEAGLAARDELRAHGLPLQDLQRDATLPTGAAYVTLDRDGVATYQFETPAAWDAIEHSAIAADVVVFGTLAQRDARSCAAVQRYAREAAVRVYDVNWRAPFTALDTVAASLSLATIVKLNETEQALLSRAWALPQEPRAFATALARRYDVRLVCMTRGAAGAALLCDDQWFEEPGVAVECIDTIGAGDAFLAALVHGYVTGDDPGHVLARANRLGAYVATQTGAMPAYEPLPVLD